MAFKTCSYCGYQKYGSCNTKGSSLPISSYTSKSAYPAQLVKSVGPSMGVANLVVCCWCLCGCLWTVLYMSMYSTRFVCCLLFVIGCCCLSMLFVSLVDVVCVVVVVAGTNYMDLRQVYMLTSKLINPNNDIHSKPQIPWISLARNPTTIYQPWCCI